MRWTSVKERVPEYSKGVLLVDEYSEIKIGYRNRTDIDGEHFHDNGGGSITEKITHWMNLPEVPGTKNKKG